MLINSEHYKCNINKFVVCNDKLTIDCGKKNTKATLCCNLK